MNKRGNTYWTEKQIKTRDISVILAVRTCGIFLCLLPIQSVSICTIALVVSGLLLFLLRNWCVSNVLTRRILTRNFAGWGPMKQKPFLPQRHYLYISRFTPSSRSKLLTIYDDTRLLLTARSPHFKAQNVTTALTCAILLQLSNRVDGICTEGVGASHLFGCVTQWDSESVGHKLKHEAEALDALLVHF